MLDTSQFYLNGINNYHIIMERYIHSEASHSNKLHELCRVCTGRSLTVKQKKLKRRKLNCKDFFSDILLTFNVNISEDKNETHSSSICYPCVNRIKRIKSDAGIQTIEKARNVIPSMHFLWEPFDASKRNTDCSVCCQYDITTFGTIGKYIQKTSGELII